MRSRTSLPTWLRLLAPLLLGTSLSAAQASARGIAVVADAGEDLSVACTMNGASVTLDGTGSTVEGAPAAGVAEASFAWEAEGVVFDDPSSPTPTASFPPGTTVVTLTVTWVPDPEPMCFPAPPCPPDPFCELEPELCPPDPLCPWLPGEPACLPGIPLPPISAQDQVEVLVADGTPPVISAVATPDVLRPPDHSLREVAVQLHAEDSCSAELTIELISLTSSEPDDAIGDGNTMADIQQAEIGKDDRHFLLRAERQGGGSGRVYTATYRATDAAGNHSDAVARVSVPHDKGSGSGPVSTFSPASNDLKAAKQAQKAAKAAAKAARRAQKQALRAARRAARAR